MTWRTVTMILIIASAVVWVGYDIYVAFGNKEAGDTISNVIRDWAFTHWFLVSLFLWGTGFLMGHFFWPQNLLR